MKPSNHATPLQATRINGARVLAHVAEDGQVTVRRVVRGANTGAPVHVLVDRIPSHSY